MKTTILTVLAVSLACNVFAQTPAVEQSTIREVATNTLSKPYEIGSSYFLVFAPVLPSEKIQLPKGVAKVIAGDGDWVQIQYSTFKNERDSKDPGKINMKETVAKAWINLEHVVAFVEAANADQAEAGAAANP